MIVLKLAAMLLFTVLIQLLIGTALKPRPQFDRTDLTMAAVCSLSAGVIMLNVDMHPAQSLLWGMAFTSLFVLLPVALRGMLRPIIQGRNELLRVMVEGHPNKP